MKTLRIAIPTKLQIHATTILSLLNSLNIPGYIIEIKFLIGKSNIDQSRSIMATAFYDELGDDDLFLFIDSDQTFTSDDIMSLINLNVDVAVGVYSSLSGLPTCRPKNFSDFVNGKSNDVFYGATGFMLIRKPILKKIEDYIKSENMGYSRFWISNDSNNIIPFFTQRLIISETIQSDKPEPEWLGEDYAFCWIVRRVGGTIKCHVSKTIGHEVPQMLYYYPEAYNSKVWDENSIVYYTGPSRIQWSPDTIKNGMSGSEVAVHNLSARWHKMGYKVVVYGNVIEGLYDGVEYLHFNKFKTNDRFNMLILWRAYGLSVLDNVKAKQLLVDLHDEPSPSYQILLDHINKVDRVFVKSKYHKSLFPQQVYQKFTVITNGLADNYFNIDSDKIKSNKNRYKLIYCSSYDRGLYEMLKYGWPIIKSKVPEAELHIYYGMDLLPADFKNVLLPMLKKNGVYEHGQVSHGEILNAKLESSIHYYVGCLLETDCISVKESVFTDCIPVVSSNSVFRERDYCLKVGELDDNPLSEKVQIEGAELVVKLLQDNKFYEESLKKIQEHKDQICNWDTVANKWSNFFFQLPKKLVL